MCEFIKLFWTECVYVQSSGNYAFVLIRLLFITKCAFCRTLFACSHCQMGSASYNIFHGSHRWTKCRWDREPNEMNEVNANGLEDEAITTIMIPSHIYTLVCVDISYVWLYKRQRMWAYVNVNMNMKREKKWKRSRVSSSSSSSSLLVFFFFCFVQSIYLLGNGSKVSVCVCV